MNTLTIDIDDIPTLAHDVGLTGAIRTHGAGGGDTFSDVIGIAIIVYEMYPPLNPA